MTSFYGSVNGGQGGSGEGIDTSTLMQKNNPTFNGTITGPNARFTGTVQIPEPTEDNHAATKGYVDAALADVDLSEVTTRMDAIETAQDELAAQLDDKVDVENPAFTGTATLDGKNIATVDQIPNISDLPYLDENNPTYTGTLTGENVTFSGTVTVATPATEGEAANKGYVDAAKTELEGDINTLQQTVANQAETINTLNQQVTNIAGGTTELPYLKNTGDSGTGVYDFTGATVNAADPVDNSNVATKRYVDQKVASAGGTGEVVSYTQGDGISISPENEISLSIDSAGANGLKVGANGLGLDLATGTTSGAMAASDKLAIASNTTEITNIKDGTTELPYLKETNPAYEGTLIGGDAIFTGSVQISTPDQDNEVANKGYVDTALAEAKSYTDNAVSGIASDETIQQIQSDIENIENGTTVLPYLPSAGGTVTGPIKYGTSPKDTSDLANKAYVDAIHVQAVADAKNYTDSEITNLENGTTELPYIKNNGDTVTGSYDLTGAAVTIAEPTVSNNPATKNYVDTKIASAGGSGEVVSYTQGNGINISPKNIISVVVAADNANGLAVDTNGIKLNVATPTTAGAMSGADKAKLDASSTTEQMNQAISSAIDEALEDPTKLPFVNINGDTMHGSLTTTELFTDFVTIRNAGTDGKTGFQNNSDTDHIRVYDKVANTLVPIEVGEPVNNQDASTKKYVDDKVTTETATRTEAIESLDEAKADKDNPTFTGIISGANATLSGTLTGNTATFSGGITVPLEPGAEGSATSKKYVDDQIAAIDVSEQIEPLAQRVTTAEGEIDTLQSNIVNITNGTTELPYIPSDGGTISGPINWGSTPQEATELANKAYVDANDSDAVNSAKEYTNAQIEIAKGYTDEAVTNLTNGTTKLPYVTKEEVEIAADTRDVARAYRYTFNDGLDGTNSNAGFGFIDFTPAIVTEKDGSTDFSPLYIGEPKKESQAATKKYVDDAITAVNVSEYTLAKQTAAEDGYFATYYLTKDGAQVGEKINIPKDYLVKEAELLEVAATDTPYSGAVIGDKYIDFTINTQASDEDEQHIYLPVKDLVDVYTGGNGINIDASNIVSVQIDAANSNGLALSSAGLKLNLATTSTAGAMSAADKTKLDTVISEEQLTAVENEVDTLQTEVNNIKDKLTIANRAVFIGDSTSQGYDNDDYSFVDIFKENGDFSGVTKLAVGGATLGPYQIVSEASGYSCLEQIQANESAISGANFCFLQFCANDVKCLVSKNVQIGTPSDASTMTTVCGYLKKCIELLYTYNPTISIVFINLATNESVIDMMWDNEVDSDADKYKFYHKVWNLSIADVLEQYNIPMINIFDWTGINANNFSNYTVHTEDGTHLNTAGNTLAYYRIKNALWNESEKSYPTQPKNLIIDATIGGNIGVENVERIKNAFDNNIQVFFNLKESEDSTEDLIVPVNFSSDVGYGSYFTLNIGNKLYLYELWTNTSGQITDISYNITDMKSNIDTALTADAATNETIQSINQDIDNIKNDYLPLNGSLGMEGDLNANSHSITNLMPPVNGGDASNKQYTDAMDTNTLSDAKSYTDAKVAEYLPLEGGVMTGVVNMGNNRIEGVSTPIDNSHVANKKYVDDADAVLNAAIQAETKNRETAITGVLQQIQELETGLEGDLAGYLPLTGGSMTGALNVQTPTEDSNAATKKYVDEHVPTITGPTGHMEFVDACYLAPGATKTWNKQENEIYCVQMYVDLTIISTIPVFNNMLWKSALIADSSDIANVLKGIIDVTSTNLTITALLAPNGIAVTLYKYIEDGEQPEGDYTRFFTNIDMSAYNGETNGATVYTGTDFQDALRYIIEHALTETVGGLYTGTDNNGNKWYTTATEPLDGELTENSYTMEYTVKENETTVKQQLVLTKV